MGTKREKNHRLPTGKISTDYRHEPTKATNAITDQKCNKTGKCYLYRMYSKERRPQYKSDKNKRSASTPDCKKIANSEKSKKHL